MSDFFINNPVLTPIFEHIKSLVDYTHIGIFYLDGAEAILVTMQGPIHLQHKNLIRFKVSDSYNISLIVRNDAPFLLADIEEDTSYAKHFKADFDQLVGDPYNYVKSWMGFPLESGHRTYGTIEVAHDVRNHYSEGDMAVLYEYIQSVSTQIENEVLKWMLQQWEMEFSALSTIDEAIFSKLDILELLQLVIQKVYQFTNTSQVDIFLAEEIFFIFVRELGAIPENVYSLSAQNPFISLIEKAIETEEPVRIPDRSYAPLSLQDELIKNDIHNLLILPIKTTKNPIGVMMAKNNIYGGFYSMHDEWGLKVLVNRASIALQNAKLFYEEQERRKFVAEYARSQERQDLAQSLHDTVAQLLFRMGLEVNWLDQNLLLHEDSKERIRTLKSLIARSDEELRSAISALNRHEVENSENMVDVLQRLVVDFQNTTEIEVNLVVLPDLAPIPFSIMETIYRIVKEALSNVRKHATAQGVLVSLFSTTTMATVTIQDNGCGFSSDAFTQDHDSKLHFGIEMMERLVAAHGGDITISNNDDHGVIVKASFPISVKENNGYY